MEKAHWMFGSVWSRAAFPQKLKSKSELVDVNHAKQASQDLENIVPSDHVFELQRFPMLHELWSRLEDDPQVEDEKAHQRVRSGKENPRVDDINWKFVDSVNLWMWTCELLQLTLSFPLKKIHHAGLNMRKFNCKQSCCLDKRTKYNEWSGQCMS